MNKETIYTARYLLPVAAPPIEDGALLVLQGRIAAVGPGKELAAAHPRAAVTDFGEAVLLPPFANAHTHLELTHFPRWAAMIGETTPSGSFVEWIQRVIRVKRKVAEGQYHPSLLAGIRLSLAAGTGAIGDILSCFPVRSTYYGSPLKGCLFFETLGHDPHRNREILKNIGRFLDEGKFGGLLAGISPHSPYTLSSEYLEELFAFARARQAPLAIHMAESLEEIAFLRDADGPLAKVLYPFVGWQKMVPLPAHRSPVAYLEERGGLSPRNLLVHGVQVTAEDVGRLSRAGATVVLCPRSNARLSVGKAPVALYLEHGVSLALGTDSLASCDSLSIWDEIAFALEWFEGRLTPRQLLTMATRGGSRALGLEGEMGVLAEGVGANFQVLASPSLPALPNLESYLCSPGRSAEVSALYLDGRDVLQKPR